MPIAATDLKKYQAANTPEDDSALVGGAKRFYRKDPAMRAKMADLLKDLHREYGFKSRFASAVGGMYVHWMIRREAKRLAAGWTYEPPTFYESNAACRGAGNEDPAGAKACRFVTASVSAREAAVV